MAGLMMTSINGYRDGMRRHRSARSPFRDPHLRTSAVNGAIFSAPAIRSNSEPKLPMIASGRATSGPARRLDPSPGRLGSAAELDGETGRVREANRPTHPAITWPSNYGLKSAPEVSGFASDWCSRRVGVRSVGFSSLCSFDSGVGRARWGVV